MTSTETAFFHLLQLTILQLLDCTWCDLLITTWPLGLSINLNPLMLSLGQNNSIIFLIKNTIRSIY